MPTTFPRYGLSLVLPLLVGVLAPAARATPPVEEQPPVVEERVFVPHAGYLRTTKLFNLARSTPVLAAPAASYALSGTRRVPVILLSFKNTDQPLPFAASAYRELLFGTTPPGKPLLLTMTQYYRDVSYGRFQVTGDVFGWHALPEDDTYYENNGNGAGKPFGELLDFGLRKLDAATDLGQYDNDGPDGVPNSGDDDGKVDTIFFVHPEAGAECKTAEVAGNIWSHSWYYSDKSYGHGAPFESDDVRRAKAPQGQPPGTGPAKLESDGNEAHILVDDYTIQPGLSCDSTAAAPEIVEIGVFCHEYGHALGLPDLYDRTPQKKPDSSGVGFWCLMAAGSYGGGGDDHSEEPVHLSAWCKQFLGWASVTPLEADDTYPLEPVEDRGLVYRIDVPASDEKEYFLVELRDPDWQAPSGRHNWDARLPGRGVAIWHVDERVGADQPSWPFAALGKGQNDNPSRPKAARHALVALMQADRKQDLEWRRGQGDGADSWLSGHEFADDGEFLAGTRAYSGDATGIAITNIDLDGSRFDFRLAAAPAAAAAASPALERTVAVARVAEEREARSVVLTTATAATTPVEREIVDLARQAGAKRVEVQLAPEGDRVQRITGLNLAAEKQSVLEDAKHRVQDELSPLLGEDVDLMVKTSYRDFGWNRQVFEQVWKREGRTLPIFDAETTLFYDRQRRLAAVVAETHPAEDIAVTGPVGALTAAEAKAVVRQAFGLDASALTGAREGIFLVGGQPGNARTAFEVGVMAGEEQEDILVYVDSETQAILSIE